MTVDTFESPRRCESPKTSTVTRMATLPSAIHVTVDIFEFRTSSESRQTSTVTRMATLTPAILVMVYTFRIQESQNDESYKETRGEVEPNLGKKRRSQTFEKNQHSTVWGLGFRFWGLGFREASIPCLRIIPRITISRIKFQVYGFT